SFLLPSVSTGAPSGKYATACTTWANAECAHESACRGDAIGFWENIEQCRQRQALRCELLGDDPDASFDPQLVGGCTFPSDCSATGQVGAGGTLLCLPPGKAVDGASCVWNEDCQSLDCAYTYDNNGIASDCGRCVTEITCSCADFRACSY